MGKLGKITFIIMMVAAAMVFSARAFASGTTGTTSDVECTITGTERNDRLVGTPGDDVICGLGGNDILIGNGGNDILIGGPGNDRLIGGKGRDTLLGEAGRDTLIGGAHSDQFIGGSGRDRLTAGTAGDTCDPNGDDKVSGQCHADLDAPVISDVMFPSQLNAGGTLTVTWRVTDSSGLFDLGLEAGAAGPTTWMSLGGKNGWEQWCGFPALSTLISGDAFDGRYEVSCSIPDNAVNGTYSFQLNAVDLFGNYSDFGVWHDFTICDSNGDDPVLGQCQADLDAPVISDVMFPSQLDAGGTLTVTWRVTDSSGLYDLGLETGYAGPTTWMYLGGKSGWVLWCGFPALSTRISGDAFDGRYEVSCSIPDNAVNGTYSFQLNAVDLFGNDGGLGVWYDFTIGGGSSDDAAPAVTDLTWSSSLKPGADIKFRWRATDETGVSYVIPWVFGPNGSLVDLNTGQLWVSYDTATLVSGNAKDGWYEVTVKLNDAAISGTYTIWVSQEDTLGNNDYTSTSADGAPYGTFTVGP